jgi:hypothetical protein
LKIGGLPLNVGLGTIHAINHDNREMVEGPGNNQRIDTSALGGDREVIRSQRVIDAAGEGADAHNGELSRCRQRTSDQRDNEPQR